MSEGREIPFRHWLGWGRVIPVMVLVALTFAPVSVLADVNHSGHVSTGKEQGSIPGAINLGLTGSLGPYEAHHHLAAGRQAAQQGETVTPGSGCPSHAPVKPYDISAINADITLNAHLDFFPGYMYVLTGDIEKVRADERKNEVARKKESDAGAITNGLSGDVAIQPLVIRANQGDCLVLTLRNQVDGEDVSLHLHGSNLRVKVTGQPATMTNPDIIVKPGKQQTFEWFIPGNAEEGARQFHSHAREQSSIGLFGALVVEPTGSRYLDPYTGKDLKSGWIAMIEDSKGPDFREFVVIYHEAGNEEFRPLNKKEAMIPQRDLEADVYRPSTRALNYRSESFMNNLLAQGKRIGFEDESMGYSAYMFGDVATPIPRSYLGDPVKWRLVHGGSEIFHSHHLHGGAIRWRKQPKLQTDLNLFGSSNFTLAAFGPVKFPPIQTTSDRIDVQTLGPSETFNKEIECGSGGCQYTAGDFLYHCHIPHHYVAGMWAYWRVYNTFQTSGAQTDTMASLQELPDRKGRMQEAVDSTKLVGKVANWFGKKFKITERGSDRSKATPEYSIEDWVEMQLPTQGQPGKVDDEIAQIKAYDASVLNWAKEKRSDGKVLYLNEPETTIAWPKYKPAVPGGRPPFLFDLATGRLAWPHLKPHPFKRPPFAPNHGGAPFLEPIHEDENGVKTTEPPKPGENGPWSLCPAEANNPATIKDYVVNATPMPITMNPAKGNLPPIIDKNGQIFVLAEEEEAIRADESKKFPLIIRANVGDCVNVTFKSKLPENAEVLYSSKVNMHIHFVQFDTQASDGVISGMSYEQSVRPFTLLQKDEKHGFPVPQNTTIAGVVKRGSDRIPVADASRFHIGNEIGIGMERVQEFEIRRISAIDGNTLILNKPLSNPHQKGEIVSVEFVRYRWYADSDTGITYWHDHAFGLTSWSHGLYGALVIEPRGSTYHDPKTGRPVRSGNLVDIHTNEPVSAHIRGSFREFVPQIQDSVPWTENKILSGTVFEKRPEGQKEPSQINKIGSIDSWALPPTPMTHLNGGERTTGSAFGMRVEPYSRRLEMNPDPSLILSSKTHGDPATVMVRTYLGDPLVIRALHQAGNEMHTFHVDGHWFPGERFGVDSLPRDVVHFGIAERNDLSIPAAGGPQRRAGDYLFYNGRASKMSEGSWGIIRVLDKPVENLEPLPGREELTASNAPLCPQDAPLKRFNVVALEHPLDLHAKIQATSLDVKGTNRSLILENREGRIFALEGEVDAVLSDAKKPHPLTLRVSVGDCVQVNLKNNLVKDQASFHVDRMAFDPHDSYGANVGNNGGDQTVAPGQSRVYTYYAHPGYGETVALIRDFGNPLANSRNSLYGAVVVGPRGSRYLDPMTQADATNAWQADVIVDPSVPENSGRVNYRDVVLFFQDEDNVIGTSFMPYTSDAAGMLAVNYRSEPLRWRVKGAKCGESVFNCPSAGDPNTPTIQAHAGDLIKINAVMPFSEQNMVFSLEGHSFPLEPRMAGSNRIYSMHQGATEFFSTFVTAGGDAEQPGDYLWMNHRLAYLEAGVWGLLRVLPRGDARMAVLPRLKPRVPQTVETMKPIQPVSLNP